jgi:hypothetical protein
MVTRLRLSVTPQLTKRVLMLSATAVLLVTCDDDPLPTTPALAPPQLEIADAAHAGDNLDFFFLPPLVPEPSGDAAFDAGAFDAGQSPVVEICLLDSDACAGTQPSALPIMYSMMTGPGSETVRVVTADEHYIVNWHTDQFALTDGTYRIGVLVAGTELGHADVQVVSGGSQLKNVDTDQYVPLKDGRTLPIKYRIEDGAVFVVGASGATVTALGNAVVLEFPADAVTVDIGVTVRPATDFPADPNLVPGSVFDFGPDGVAFAHPVLLTISYDPTLIPAGSDEDTLILVRLVDGIWTEISGSTVNAVDHTVTGPIQGFSQYAIQLRFPPALSSPLAYSSNSDGDNEIFTRNGVEAQLTDNTADDGAPDWLNGQIAFHSDQSGDFDIWVMDDQGGNPVNLTNSPGVWELGPKWSPDGTRIAYVAWIPGGTFDIWVMNADGSGHTNLTDNPGNDGGTSWSPDGSQIAFQSRRDGNLDVYVMNSDGSGDPIRLTFDAKDDGSPDWSPDGTQLAFSRVVPGVEGDIWVMNADGTGPQNVTNSASLDAGPAWSPDGTQIAFERFVTLPSGPADIWVIGPDGTGAAPVVANAAASERGPAWQKTLPPVVIEIIETIAVADAVQVLPPVVIEVAEDIAVTDAVQVLPPVVIEITEAITVSDVVTVSN